MFTATSDRAVGLLREAGSNDESANVAGDRGGRRVRPGLRPPSGDVGDGDLLERSKGTGKPGVGERYGETIGHARRLRAAGDLSPSGGGCTSPSGEVWQRSRGEEPKDLGPPQLDPARSVPIGARTEGSGNRVSVKRCHGFEAGKPVSSPKRGIARHAARRDGRCEQVETKANARHSTSGGPVHSSSPGRRAGESPQRQPGRFRFRRSFRCVGSVRHPTPSHADISGVNPGRQRGERRGRSPRGRVRRSGQGRR